MGRLGRLLIGLAGAMGVALGFGVIAQAQGLLAASSPAAVAQRADQAILKKSGFAAFAQRVVDATKSYQCAKLPLPSYMLGSPHQFTFRFSP